MDTSEPDANLRPRCSSSTTIRARGCCSGRRWKWPDFASSWRADGAGRVGSRSARNRSDCVILDVVMPGHERLRRLQRAARAAGMPPRADPDADQPGRHGIGEPRLHRRRDGFLVERHQSDAARAAGEVPGARQADPGPIARRARRGCDTSPTTIRSRRCPTASACCRSWTSRSVGRSAAARHRRVDARRGRFLPHQRHAGPGGGRCPAEGRREPAAALPARLRARRARIRRRARRRHQGLGRAHGRRRILLWRCRACRPWTAPRSWRGACRWRWRGRS